MPSRIKSIINILLLGFVFGVFVGFSADNSMNWRNKTIKESRERLLDLYNAVSINERDSVIAKKIITKVDRERVYVSDESNNDKWYVSSPTEFFQTNWILIFCFSGEHLKGVRFGISDNVVVSPDGAPPTKGVCAPQ